jgi:hypothetical protein
MAINVPEFPTPENRLWPWGDLDGNWWKWMGGYWARLHPTPPGELLRTIFVGTIEQVRSFDGGDGTDETPTDFTGPMWEVAADMSAVFPVGVGEFTNAGQVDVGQKTTSLNIAGEDKVKLVTGQLASHTHDFSFARVETPDTGGKTRFPNGDSGATPTERTYITEASTGDNEAHNNLPPMIGVYFLQRTARKYYTSPYYTTPQCQCAPTSEVLTGTGSPEGVVTADTGAVYSDTAASTLYIKSSGSGNTGWVLA